MAIKVMPSYPTPGSQADKARQLAAEMASCMAKDREKTKVCSALEKDGAYEELKEKIQMARKPRMRTVEQFICDDCDSIIQSEEEGYVVKGNIYTANPHRPGGLIGNNFPKVEEGDKIDPNMIMQNVLCRTCMMRALGLEKVPVVRKTRGGSSKPVSSKVAKDLEEMLKRR
jgi:hypothetical protein